MRWSLLSFLSLFIALPLPAQELVVGIKESPPFVIKGEQGNWRGISYELWTEIAAELGLAFRLEEHDLSALVEGVGSGALDVGVAALTVTPEREADFDFSHPFHTTGLSIAVKADQRPGWLSTMGALLSTDFWKLIASLLVALGLAALGVWLFERRHNDEFRGRGGGLGQAMWWSVVTMTTVGYGDKSPRSVGGRVVAVIWMFSSVVMISTFTAAAASAFTTERLSHVVQGPDDLDEVRVASVPGSTSARYLDQRGVSYQDHGSVADALSALARGDADAVVYDRPILSYLVRQTAGELRVLPGTFYRQDYAFALRDGSPLRERINRLLLKKISGRGWEELLTRYLGDAGDAG